MDNRPLPSKHKIETAIARLKKLIPQDACVGFYPSSGTQIAVFNFDQLPLDYVICSDYDIKETVQGKIVTVAADNNLCLRYILEAGIKLDALFAVQDGAIEGGNYEWVNSIGFLGRVLPAMKKSFVFVQNANKGSYISFSEGPVKKIEDDVPIYRAASYSTYDVNTNTYSIVKYKKDYRGSRTLGFEEQYAVKANKSVERRLISFLKIHYKTIWEDQKWLDGIFVRKRTLDNSIEKTSLRRYWPANYMSEKVFDIMPLTRHGKLLPLLKFAAKNKLQKIGLVALTGETGKLPDYEQIFEQNYQELLEWAEPYPKEFHLYFIDKKNYTFALNAVKDFPESQDLVLKPADNKYLKLLVSFYSWLSRYNGYTSYREGDWRIINTADLFVETLKDYYEGQVLRQYAETSDTGTRPSDKQAESAKLYKEAVDEVTNIEKALMDSLYLEVSGKGYQLPPACVSVSKSGRYSVHDLFHLSRDVGYVLWDNKRKVMKPELFRTLNGVDEQYGRVYCHRYFRMIKWEGNLPALDVDLENIEGLLTWRYTEDVYVQNQRRKKLTFKAMMRRSGISNNVIKGPLNDFSVAYKIPDFFKIRKAFFKKLLFEDIAEKEAYTLIEEMEKFSHPHKNFWFQFIFSDIDLPDDPLHPTAYYGSNTNVIAELLIEADPGCLSGPVTYGEAGILEPYYEFCPADRVEELVSKYKKLKLKYEDAVLEETGLPF